MMATMNAAAKSLGISPRLQEHELTMEAIAEALENLKQAAVASVVVQGVELVKKFKLNPSGAKQAHEFIQKHKTSNSVVPTGLWDELDHIAAHVGLQMPAQMAEGGSPGKLKVEKAGGSSASPSSKASASSQPGPCKVEQAGSDAASSASGSKGHSTGEEGKPTRGFKRARRC